MSCVSKQEHAPFVLTQPSSRMAAPDCHFGVLTAGKERGAVTTGKTELKL